MSGPGLRVDIDGLELRYREAQVLTGVDLHIEPGERVCLVGPNGAGKSSLLRCLTGLVEPTAGQVRLDGVPLAEIERSTLARTISVVPSQVELPFSMPVEDVVRLGRIPHENPFTGQTDDDRAAADEAIERVGIGRLRGRDARQLSMGERQLVLVAMAVAQGGRLIVLDEPTVHLDLRHQVEVLQLIEGLADDGLTVLAVLHDLPLAAHFFPRLVLLDEGRLMADGAPAEVLSPERIREVYAVDPRFVPSLVSSGSP
ncbi:MAG: ABC transporter ATP-binding protein [Candidatus Limnocylindrales bacterium]